MFFLYDVCFGLIVVWKLCVSGWDFNITVINVSCFSLLVGEIRAKPGSKWSVCSLQTDCKPYWTLLENYTYDKKIIYYKHKLKFLIFNECE